MSDRELARERNSRLSAGRRQLKIQVRLLEAAFEKQLRGRWEGQRIEVDGAGPEYAGFGWKNGQKQMCI